MGNKTWETLFSYATEQLKSAQLPKNSWSFGGGTVLMLKYDHRLSKDIDIFFRDPQLLNSVSPRINDAVEDKIQLYSEHTTFTRIQFAEGEVDFIVSPQISNCRPTIEKVLQEHIYVDSPVEIIAKKVHFRAEEFKPRDVFDLAVVFSARKEQLLQNAFVFEPRLEILEQRINSLAAAGDLDEHLQSLDLRPGGQKVRGKEVNLCREFIQAVSRKIEQDKRPRCFRPPRNGQEL